MVQGLQITQIPLVSTASSWGYSQLLPTPVDYNTTAKILCSALTSPLPIFTNYFLNLYSHQAFLLFCCIFPNGLLNLPDLFHATPQLEGYPTFSCINHSSPIQNITPVLISLNLKGWEFFLNQKCEICNTQGPGPCTL